MLFPTDESANLRSRMFQAHYAARRRSTAPDLSSQMGHMNKITEDFENAKFMEKVCNIQTCFKCEKALMKNIEIRFCQMLTSIHGCCDYFNNQQAF